MIVKREDFSYQLCGLVVVRAFACEAW